MLITDNQYDGVITKDLIDNSKVNLRSELFELSLKSRCDAAGLTLKTASDLYNILLQQSPEISLEVFKDC